MRIILYCLLRQVRPVQVAGSEIFELAVVICYFIMF